MLLLAIGDIHIPQRAIDFPNEFKKLLLPGKIQQVLCTGNVTSSVRTLRFLDSLSPDLQIVKGAYDFDSKLPLSSMVQHDQLKIGFLNGFNVVPKNDPLSLLIEARKMDVDILIWGGTHRVEAYTLDNKLFINPGSATGAFSTEELSEEEDNEEEDNEEEEDEDEGENGEGEVGENQATNKHVNEPGSDQQNEINNDKSDQRSSNDAEKGEQSKNNNEEKGTESSEENGFDSEHKQGKVKSADKEDAELNIQNLLRNIEEDIIDPIPSFCLLDIQGSVCTLYIYTYLDDEVKVDKVTYRKD